MNIVDKLREWQRGERDWNQADMVREFIGVLEFCEEIAETHYNSYLALINTLNGDRHD